MLKLLAGIVICFLIGSGAFWIFTLQRQNATAGTAQPILPDQVQTFSPEPIAQTQADEQTEKDPVDVSWVAIESLVRNCHVTEIRVSATQATISVEGGARLRSNLPSATAVDDLVVFTKSACEKQPAVL